MNVLKKVAKKVENLKIVKNPKFLVIGLIIIIVLITLIYFIFLKYSPIMNFKYEGYAISGKEITENLLGSSAGNSSSANKNIELTKIEEQGTIFKKLNDYFVGNKGKTEINLNYPIYINGNSSLYNLSEASTLISKNFEEISSYPNLSISEGKIYDGNNLERADAKEYIFIKTTDNIYINLYEIKIKTTANEYTIPVNSIIAFTENEIRYYSANNNVLVFNQINDIDNNSNVQMVENNYTYKELLTKLGILQDENNNTDGEESTETDVIQEDTTNEEVTEDNENIDKEQQNIDNNTTNQNVYVKPEVTTENFIAEVYTAKSTLHIKDPSGRIVEAPTFEIYKDGKIYLRRTFSNSGEIQITGLIPDTEYEVVGKYIYLNENNQKVENTFYEGKFTTKGYEELGSIEIQKENGEIFSNKIQLTKVKIKSDLNAEVLKGINQVDIETGEIRTVLKNSQVNELLQGKEITIESSEGLKSDSPINYAIKFYDKNGIELKVNNNEGKTRTSKEKPTVRVTIKEQDIVSVTLGLKLTNRDNVELENYKYVVTRPNGEIVQEKKLSENESELLLEDLDQNQYYKISIYADYDLNDNRGKQEQIEIGNLVFATQPISTLGSLELIVENKELTSITSIISYKIDEDRTDKRLIQILNELTINIVEQSENNTEQDKKEGTIVYTDTLTGDEITNLQQAETKEIKYENLKSNTTYTIEIIGKVQLGNTQETIPITYNYKEFTTLKIPAKIEIRNQFVTGNLIDFDVKIEDIDNSVLNNIVRMELRDSSNNWINLQEVTTNENYIRKTYEKLEENQKYTLRFYADQYNEGSTDETYKVNYLIKEIEIVTVPGISGKIGLTELSKKATGKNLVDMSSETKWYVYPNFNTADYYGKEYDEKTKILMLGGHGNARRAVYDLREYAGQEVTMSFKAKAVNGSQNAYIQNSKTNTNRTKIEGLTTDWNDFKYTLTIDGTGYLGFYINGGNGIEIQELQVELGNQKTSYEEFKYTLQSKYSINLEDRRDEITTNDYYIKIYETQTGKQYKVELVIKLREREYVLSELEYNTQDTEEIKGIYNKDDFLEIQPRGHYIVLGDIDLTDGENNKYTFGTTDNTIIRPKITDPEKRIYFDGYIDFNGYSLIHDSDNNNREIFGIIGKNAIIENLVFRIKLNTDTELSKYFGLVRTNYGTIRNVDVELEECKNLPNQNIILVGYHNYGILENFIIHLNVPLYGARILTAGFYRNFGTIQNGYLYGENIKSEFEILAGQTKEIAPLNITNNGKINNVYSLISVDLGEQQNITKNVSNIILTNNLNASVSNIYSVGAGKNVQTTNGPNIYSVNSTNIKNSYYFLTQTFNNRYNTKTTELALLDCDFQNNILNTDNAFDLEYTILKGFYPHLKLPDCMPSQIYVELPTIDDNNLVDILSTELIESDETIKVRFVINNPAGETITNINIENIKCEIVDQKYDSGKSEVIAILKEPQLYVSNYSVLDVTIKSAYNLEYTRKFEKNERVIYIELYRPINNIEDWKHIEKSPTENYKLMTDLDFRNETDINIDTTFSGKLDGNSYTIKNITIQENTQSMFKSLTGQILNLNVENYKQENNTNGNLGFIATANKAIINNVNISNLSISSNSLNIMVYIGGLVGTASGTTINNSSLTNVSIKNNKKISEIRAGGLIGTSSTNRISNTYIQNLDIDLNNIYISNGIGGCIGYDGTNYYQSSISNCYVIGKITTDVNKVGGLIGQETEILIEKCYTMVDIYSKSDVIGGIIGYAKKDLTNITNNLSIGNIYTEINTENIRRIAGNIDSEANNYAYTNQKINGNISQDNMGAVLVNRDQLVNKASFEKLGLGDAYDYSQVEYGILPKLYYTDKNELLKNQQDNYLDTEVNLSIEDIAAEKTGSNIVNARITIDNEANLEITDITVQDMEITINRISNQNGKTYIDLIGSPIIYYDSYNISEIKYIMDKEEKTVKDEGKIDIQFFKEIYTFEDWQSIEHNTYQNYRLMNDIDFSGKENINSNINIGRFEADGESKFLKNIKLNATNNYFGLINEVKTNIKNIGFENINIEASSGNSTIGVISINNGSMESVKFKDITINAEQFNRVGCIGYNLGNGVVNIELSNVTITGKSYVGGFAGQASGFAMNRIVADEINVQATGDYIGGVFGNLAAVSNVVQQMQNIHGNNITVKGNDFVAGLSGSVVGGANTILNNSIIENSEVYGHSYVGGIAGQMFENNNNKVKFFARTRRN